MPPKLDGNDESRRFLLEMKILAAIGGILICLYSSRFWASGQFLRILGVGMLTAGAALMSGFLLGFIFAIPRGDKRGKTTAAEPEDARAPDSGGQPGPVLRNGNLVEISDWLTKILLGVGLVELHSITDRLGKLSYYLAPGLQPTPCAGSASCAESLASGQAAGLAILIFYSALGFLLGYVWTVIFFQGDLEGKLKTEHRDKITANAIWWAEASINANQFDEAKSSVDEALVNDPRNGYAVMTKARILKRQALQPGRYDRDKLLKQAISFADQSIALMPGKGEPFYNKACYQVLLDPTGLRSDALANLASAFRLNPALRQIAVEDPDLDSLRQDPEFIMLTGADSPPAA